MKGWSLLISANPYLRPASILSSPFSVIPTVVKDWKLMGGRNGNAALIGKPSDNIIERRPQIVNEIAEDDAESWLLEIARAEHKGIRTAIAVSINSG